MRLSELLQVIDHRPATNVKDREIAGLAYDSRRVEANYLFVAIQGEKKDGNHFVPQAVQRGARVIVSERATPSAVQDGWIQVPNARKALASLAAHFYGYPTQKLGLIGITGTNGKTSTAYLVESILLKSAKVGLISTIEYRGPAGTLNAERTTPESLDLQRMLGDFVEQGCQFAVMEVSSHALALDRVYCSQFRSAVFTNLTQDHLDYHQTLGNYFEAKKRLFVGTGFGPPRQSILNCDDAHGVLLEEFCYGRCLTYGVEHPADFMLEEFRFETQGMYLRIRTPDYSTALRTSLLGRPNLSNILAAVAVAYDLGCEADQIKEGLEKSPPIPGRFEPIDCGQPFQVFVDYAHTPDALHKVLEMARELTTGRVLVLFGCGGERDRTKRPLMARTVEQMADICWITSDNPRSEDPKQILSDIEAGFKEGAWKRRVELDRKRAVESILHEARDRDVVILAGKGHENSQILADRTIHFDDREEARLVLREMGATR